MNVRGQHPEGAIMKQLPLVALAFLLGAGSGALAQQPPAGKTLAATLEVYVFPSEGQKPEVQSTDEAKCYAWAVENTGIDPFELQKQTDAGMQQAAAQQAAAQKAGTGARAKGALAGAAAGALIGGIAGDAGQGAAIGATAGVVAGGAKRRRAQQQGQAQAQATAAATMQFSEEQKLNFRKAFSVCLEAKKYMVKI
jgi:uncharacterized protein YcfJ